MLDKEIVSEVAASIGLTPTLVSKIYRTYWKAIRTHIEELPLKENLSDREFQSLQTNVNIPSIGKLYITLDRYRNLKKMFNPKKEK